MERAILLLVALAVSSSRAQEFNDAGVVREILDTNGMAALPIDQVATMEQGRVVTLDLSNKDISRTGLTYLPPSVGRLTACTVLLLNDNDLTALPEEIGDMASLTKLGLRNNSLKSLPESIGKLSELAEMEARNNELKELPSSIGKLTKVWKLHLWGNSLTSLPATIGGMTGLRELYVKGNDLTALPAGITKLDLTYLDYQENRLCELPPALDAWMKKWDKKYLSWQKCWK